MVSSNSKSKIKNKIIIKGARVNNLRNISLDIPRDEFVVVTGLSGSGKSSLAFDTIYAEGNRRYMEGMSSYIRNFLDPGAKPDVDKIENLSPSIAIDQKSISRSPRSTVGTLTEVYDYLRILYAKVGRPHCWQCGELMQSMRNDQIFDEIVKYPSKTQIAFLAKFKEGSGKSADSLQRIEQLGYARVRFQEKIQTIQEARGKLVPGDTSQVDIVIDRLMLDQKNIDKERIIDSIETAMKLGKGSMMLFIDNTDLMKFNRDLICENCGVKIQEISPRSFSFNSPDGACHSCSGLGVKPAIDPQLVIPNRSLALSEGAIRPWGKSGGKLNEKSTQFQQLKKIARKYKFSISTPVSKIPEKKLNVVLYGDKTVADNKEGVFKGVITELEEKYNNSRSEYIKKEIEKYMTKEVCPVCSGKKLKKKYLGIKIENKSIDDAVNLSVTDLKNFIEDYSNWKLTEKEKKIVNVLAVEILERLKALEGVGLEYLSMARGAETISGGEAQRIRLAVQIKSEIMGVIYVLDEPSVGLHSRDTEKLIDTIKVLKKAGNSIIVVEHDEAIIRQADWIIDMGPGAGEEGGTVIYNGDYKGLMASKNTTAQYLSGKKKVFDRKKKRPIGSKNIQIIGAQANNLKNVSVKIPLKNLTVVCGVSGSGKSTLIDDILAKALNKHFFKTRLVAGKHKDINGLSNIKKVISVDQEPIGRTPRSNVATYTGVFSHVRDLFADTQEAQNHNFNPSYFSFNMKGGRCEVCQGEGYRRVEMHLMPDMFIKCEACGGTRFNQKVLQIEFQGKNIAEVLDMSVGYALAFFKKYPLIADKLKVMEDVGLGYLKLGQSAPNLSGGEAQRIKLATELARKSTGKTLYILDEPTIGLHFEDVKNLLKVLHSLVDKGNSVLIVEHNTDVINSADWVIELGPEGGQKGGLVVFEGNPADLKKANTATSNYL